MPRLNSVKFILLIAAVFVLSTAHPLMAAPEVYTIQVSAHRTAAEAETRVSDLAIQGLEAYTSEERVAGRTWFRVYIGRYTTRSDALGHARDLKERRLISDFWVKTTTHLPGEMTAAVREPKAVVLSAAPVMETMPVVEPMSRPMSKMEAPMAVSASTPMIMDNESPDYLSTETVEPLGVLDFHVSDPEIIEIPADAQIRKVDAESAALTGGGSAKAGTGQPEPEVVRFGQPKEATIGGFSPDGPNDYIRGPFYIGVRAGGEQWLKAKDFTLSRTIGAHTTHYQVDLDRAGFAAFLAGYRLNPYFSIEGMAERTWAADIYGYTGGLGLKGGMTLPNNLYTYGKINALYGSFNWNNVPGKFDNSYGYELACGLDINMNRFKLGFELGYRSLQFEYDAPNDGATYSGSSDMDLSSVRISTSLSYAF